MPITVTGNVKNNGQNIIGGPVQLRTASTDVLLDSGFTTGSGDYQLTSTTSLQVKVWVDRGGTHETSSPALGPGGEPEYNFTSTPNANPSLGAISNVTYTENTGTHTADHSISDSDGDIVTMVKVSGPSWFTTDTPDNAPPPYIGRRYFNTTGVTPGGYSASVKVTDDWHGASGTSNFTITIESDNSPPVLTNPGTKNYQNNSGIQQFQLSATDADGDPINYFKVSGPAWATVTGSGLVSVDTDAATRGAHNFTWAAEDDVSNDQETHTINILNNVPVLTDPGGLSFVSGSGLQTYQVLYTDADNDTLTFTKTAGDALATVSSSGLITVDTGNVDGSYSITVEGNDGNGGTDSLMIPIILDTPDPAPEVWVIT